MRTITHIVLHCTATPQTATVQAIQNYWRKNLGWKQPGYHHIIHPDGRVEDLLPIDQVSNGVAGHNANSIHISYIGGVDAHNNPVDNRTQEQKDAQVELVKKYQALFPKAVVLGHRDFPGVKKACPSFDVKTWLKSVGLTLLAVLLLWGCNPARRVMNNKQAFDKVGEAWSKDHPCVNDTVTTIIPGDTTVEYGGYLLDTMYYETTVHDTVPVKVKEKSRLVYITIHDTIRNTVRDTRAEKVLANELGRCRDSLNQTTIQRNAFEASRNGWRRTVYTMSGLAVLLLIGGYIFFRCLLRPRYK